MFSKLAIAVPDAFSRLRESILRMPAFLLALIITITIAIVLTVISVFIYVNSGVSSLDLSRPGFEQARSQLKNPDASATFDAEGPINPQVLDVFKVIYDSRLKEMKDSGNFTGDVINDSNLGIDPRTSSNRPASP